MPRHRSCCGETGQLYPTIPHTPFRVQCPPLQLSHKGEKGWKILLGCSPRPYTPYSDKFPKDILRLGSRDCSVASREDVSHGSFHSGSKPQQSFAPEDKAGFAHYSSCAQVECRGTRERHPNHRGQAGLQHLSHWKTRFTGRVQGYGHRGHIICKSLHQSAWYGWRLSCDKYLVR